MSTWPLPLRGLWVASATQWSEGCLCSAPIMNPPLFWNGLARTALPLLYQAAISLLVITLDLHGARALRLSGRVGEKSFSFAFYPFNGSQKLTYYDLKIGWIQQLSLGSSKATLGQDLRAVGLFLKYSGSTSKEVRKEREKRKRHS